MSGDAFTRIQRVASSPEIAIEDCVLAGPASVPAR
jgi:hypothetical protein